MAHRLHPTPNEMNVKRVSSRPPNLQKTKEKLKNPQQAKTRAVKSNDEELEYDESVTGQRRS
jgi:hypothetical protein